MNPRRDGEVGRPSCSVPGVLVWGLAEGSNVAKVVGKTPVDFFTAFTCAAQDANMQAPREGFFLSPICT